MRLLVVTPEAPAAHHVNGGATRQFQLLSRLVELGHEVTLVAAVPHSSRPHAEELRAAGFEVLESRRPASRVLEVIRALRRRPSLLVLAAQVSSKELISAVLWTELRPIVTKLLASREFDLVMIEHESAMSWIDDIRTAAPTVLTIHEFESAQLFASAERHRNIAAVARRRNARLSLKSERNSIPRFSAVITMSDRETLRLKAAVPDHPRAYAVGNGADESAFATEVPSPGHGRVLFAGTMVFPPNQSASRWLARDVWPLVAARVPEASLEIVGRAPSRAIRSLGELPGVSVTADAPTMTPHLSAADVCVVPMLEGGGTRLKLLEAMAAGRAIVATSNGTDGVDVRDRRELLIADSTAEFAVAVVELLEDSELRERLATVARAKADASYTWAALGDELESALRSITSDEPSGVTAPLQATEA